MTGAAASAAAVVLGRAPGTPLTPQMVLTGQQVKDLLEFVAPDGDADQLETEVTIGFFGAEAHSGPGLYAWITEYPEEGAIALFEVTSEGKV